MADEHGGFYQFPLCLLAREMPFHELLTETFGYGVCHYLDKTHGPSWRTEANRGGALAGAREVIGFDCGSAAEFLAAHGRAAAFETIWKNYGRTTCFVRLRADIHRSAQWEDAAISEREWRILAAIFSAIGTKPMARLGWDAIQLRASGWLTVRRPGAETGPLFPRGQIERTLGELLKRGFVHAATYRRRERYWSHRHTQDEIWDLVEKIKVAKARASSARRHTDAMRAAALHAKIFPGALSPHPEIVKNQRLG